MRSFPTKIFAKIMKLPNLPFALKKEKEEYYLALLLNQNRIAALILLEKDGILKQVNHHAQQLDSLVDEMPGEELLQTLDRIISHAEESLPSDIETHKTIFGLEDTWVEEKKIKHDYLQRLKKISTELDLKPIGFIVISEAIAHLLQKEEGAPVSAILVEINKKRLKLSLLRSGEVIESQTGEIAENTPQSVDNLLKHFKSAEIFPSRLLLHSTKNHDLTQEFLDHSWSKSLPFLHMPQVSRLPLNFDLSSIAFGAATQLGLQIQGKLPLAKTTDNEKTEEEIPVSTKTLQNEAEDFGFVIGSEKNQAAAPVLTAAAENKAPNEEKDLITKEKNALANLSKQLTAKTQTLIPFVGSFFKSWKRLASRLPFSAKNAFFLIPIGLLLLLAAGFFLYTKMLQASVVLTLSPKHVQAVKNVNIATDAGNDFSNNTLAGQTVEATLEGVVETQTTGKKEIGDKARGTITIYNQSDTKKTIPQGTVVTSSNQLQFTLDKDVTINAAQGDIFTGIKSGTADAPVTAEKIGEEYNLAQNTTFTFSQNSTLAAKNSAPFQGGSKKTVTVVADKDLTKLVSDLGKSLDNKALDALSQNAPPGTEVVPLVTDTTVVAKSFDKKVNEEAAKVTLKGKIRFRAIAYKKSDLTAYAKSILLTDPAKMTVSEKTINNTLTDLKIKNKNTIFATCTMAASLLPNLDTNMIVSQIAGLTQRSAKEKLTSLPQVKNVTLTLSPSLPLITQTLPKDKNRIKLKIQTDGQ